MSNSMRQIFSIVVLTFTFTLTSFAQDKHVNHEMPNFHRINEYLYRGAQPADGDFRNLAQLGIKTVVNLRIDDANATAERTKVEAAGMRYFNIPFKRYGQPSNQQIEEVLKLINSPEYQPIFVHCRRGEDRTGTIIAVYRIEHDGWTSGQAKAEAKKYGLKPWQIGMKKYIRERWAEKSAGRSVPTTHSTAAHRVTQNVLARGVIASALLSFHALPDKIHGMEQEGLTNEDNRREHPRYNVNFPVSWTGNHAEGVAVMTQISLGGCFLRSDKLAKPGEAVSFVLRLQSGWEVTLWGNVIYEHVDGGFGLQFSFFQSEGERRKLESLVKALADRPQHQVEK